MGRLGLVGDAPISAGSSILAACLHDYQIISKNLPAQFVEAPATKLRIVLTKHWANFQKGSWATSGPSPDVATMQASLNVFRSSVDAFLAEDEWADIVAKMNK